MKVAVAMATYNGEKYLDQQIQSILAQTLKPVEIIICDDASTDGTAAILEKYRQQQLLTYVINDTRLGLIGNFQKAVSLTSPGNYVALCDQDDVWLPEKLEKSAAFLEEFDNPAVPCFMYGDMTLVNQHGQVLNPSFRNEMGQDKYRHNLQSLLFNNFVTGCTVLMNPEAKRRFAEAPPSVQFNHDGWLALIAFTFGRAQYLPLPLVWYRKHDNNASIAANTKPRNRYRSTMNELLAFIKGKDDFLIEQFKAVRMFYKRYADDMMPEARLTFEGFLALENKPYPVKKHAYRSMFKKLSV